MTLHMHMQSVKQSSCIMTSQTSNHNHSADS